MLPSYGEKRRLSLPRTAEPLHFTDRVTGERRCPVEQSRRKEVVPDYLHLVPRMETPGSPRVAVIRVA
jgi:hypothetical protein